MNKTRVIFFCCTVVTGLAFLSNSVGVAEHQGKDRTGAPGSDQPCSQCHSSNSFSPNPIVFLNDLEGTTEFLNYLPGETMRLNFLVNTPGNPAGFGLQATALLSNNSNAGSFSNPSSNGQLENVAGRHIFEHNDISTSHTFSVDWTAPAAGSGPVTVYYSSIAANGNGGTAGDGFGGGSTVFGEGTSTGICMPDAKPLESAVVRAGSVDWPAQFGGHVRAFSASGACLKTWPVSPGQNALSTVGLPSGIVILTSDQGNVFRFWNP
jgi:hypothetical protein